MSGARAWMVAVIAVAACGRQLVDDDPILDASTQGDGGSSADGGVPAPADGASPDGAEHDGAPSSCAAETSERRIAFVTADVFPGDLAGSVGTSTFDNLCNSIAVDAGWMGKFKAFVRDGDGNGAVRISSAVAGGNGADEGWYRVDGTKAFDGTLEGALAPLSLTERCTAVTDDLGAWTGSSTASGANDCESWTSGASTGRYGDPNATDARWEWSAVGPCDVARHVYCFQVGH
ncbi:MAG: hypothetical protein KIS78_00035 [Labilithrix sp.]|nr:hypothetical protein [Labilithrix sp.]